MGLFRFIVDIIKLTIFITVTIGSIILFIWVTSTILKLLLSFFFPEHADIVALLLAVILIITAFIIINKQL